MKKNPWPFILVGIILIIAGIGVMLIDIQTAESVISGYGSTGFHPDMGVLMQPVNLFTQGMEAQQGMAVIFSWLAWLFQIVFIWLHDGAHDLVRSLNRLLPRALLTLEIVSVGFLALTNYLFAPTSIWWLRIIFMLIMVGAELFCLVLGIHSFDYGIKLMFAPSPKPAAASPKP